MTHRQTTKLKLRFFSHAENQPDSVITTPPAQALKKKRYVRCSEAEKQFLRDHWQTMTTIELASALGRSRRSVKYVGQAILKLRKTKEAYRALMRRPNASHFKPGQLAPHIHYGDGPIIRIRNKGKPYQFIRIGICQWQAYHRWLWIQHRGPVPKGSIVVFVNGDQMDVRIENLKIITRKENRHRNSASSRLSDGYVANALVWQDQEGKQALLEQPGLIELKRTELRLRRQLKHATANAPAPAN